MTTVNTSSKVKVKNSITFEKHGVVVGVLDAEYDLKNLPPELHQSALVMMSQTRRLILCDDITEEEKRELEEERNKPWWKLW
jgi:hypothetical protein